MGISIDCEGNLWVSAGWNFSKQLACKNINQVRVLTIPIHPRPVASCMATNRIRTCGRWVWDQGIRRCPCQPPCQHAQERLWGHGGLERPTLCRNPSRVVLQKANTWHAYTWVCTKCISQVPTQDPSQATTCTRKSITNTIRSKIPNNRSQYFASHLIREDMLHPGSGGDICMLLACSRHHHGLNHELHRIEAI